MYKCTLNGINEGSVTDTSGKGETGWMAFGRQRVVRVWDFRVPGLAVDARTRREVEDDCDPLDFNDRLPE
jgi:hypothetical protein